MQIGSCVRYWHVMLLAVLIGLMPIVGVAQEASPAAPPDATFSLSLPTLSTKSGGTLEKIPCPVEFVGNEIEGKTYYCASFTVPQNWDDPNSTTIDTTVLVLKALSDHPDPDPYVLLSGGPGQSSIVFGGVEGENPLRATRDLVYPAQRGTLFSQRLDLEECLSVVEVTSGIDAVNQLAEQVIAPPATPPADVSLDEAIARASENAGLVNAACVEAFTSIGLDLTQFNTRNSVRDVVELMKALDYTEYNLVGVSYGTKLALRIMNDFPNSGVRSAVLDSTAFPSANLVADEMMAPYEAVMHIFDQCESDAACAAAYPDIKARAVTLLDMLETRPITDSEGTIAAIDLAGVLKLINNTRPAFFPQMIAELEQGNTATYRALQQFQIGIFSAGEPGATANVQAFFGTVLMRTLNSADPIGGLSVFNDLVEAYQASDPPAAIAVVIAAHFDGKDEANILAILSRFDHADYAGLKVVLAPESGPEASPAAVSSIADSTAVFQQHNESRFLNALINCGEAMPGTSPDTVWAMISQLEARVLARSQKELAGQFASCVNLTLAPDNPGDRAAVSIDVPILLLHGEFDTSIPLASVESNLNQLENAQLIVAPSNEHSVLVLSDTCVYGITTAFVNDPDATLDPSCLDTRRVEFILPADGPATPGATPEAG